MKTRNEWVSSVISQGWQNTISTWEVATYVALFFWYWVFRQRIRFGLTQITLGPLVRYGQETM